MSSALDRVTRTSPTAHSSPASRALASYGVAAAPYSLLSLLSGSAAAPGRAGLPLQQALKGLGGAHCPLAPTTLAKKTSADTRSYSWRTRRPYAARSLLAQRRVAPEGAYPALKFLRPCPQSGARLELQPRRFGTLSRRPPSRSTCATHDGTHCMTARSAAARTAAARGKRGRRGGSAASGAAAEAAAVASSDARERCSKERSGRKPPTRGTRQAGCRPRKLATLKASVPTTSAHKRGPAPRGARIG
eukprot:143071-Chlamydomonas_euryale.AAC.2